MYQAVPGGVPHQLRSTMLALQRRLWWRHVLAGALRGLTWGAALATVLVLVALWETQEPTRLQPLVAGGALTLALVVLAAVRGPTLGHTARVADQRLGLEERLATALEILEGRLSSSLAGRQLADAWRSLEGQPHREVAPLQPLKRQALLSVGWLGLFVAGLLVAQQFDPAHNPVAALRRNVEEQLLASGGLGEALSQLPILKPGETAAPFTTSPPNPVLNAQTEEQLREQMARSRNQQAALSRLARALMGTAAARQVGEQLQRGDYAQAASALERLARENDQLSREAKAELADALRQAASETGELSPDLAQDEERAARALAARDYRATQQALEQLGQGMAEAGRQVVPQEELAQAWQRLQENRLEDSGPLSGGGESAPTGDFQVAQTAGPADAPPAATFMGEGDMEGAGQAMGSPTSPGTGVGAYDPESKATRLNVAGQELAIEGRPSGSGEGRGTGEASGPAVSLKDVDESDAVLEGVPQPTDPIRDNPEHTNVPLRHLQAVHDYFQSGEKNP